jgi:hypothetical protein
MPLRARSSARTIAFLSPCASVSGVVISTTAAGNPGVGLLAIIEASIRDLDAAADHLSDSPIASAARGKSNRLLVVQDQFHHLVAAR